MILDLKTSDENCRNHKTLSEEDFLGKICRLASSCHGKTVVQRYFDRFRLFIYMHWHMLQDLPYEQIKEAVWGKLYNHPTTYGCLFLRCTYIQKHSRYILPQALFKLYLASHWEIWEHSECHPKKHDLVMEGLVKQTKPIWFWKQWWFQERLEFRIETTFHAESIGVPCSDSTCNRRRSRNVGMAAKDGFSGLTPFVDFLKRI